MARFLILTISIILVMAESARGQLEEAIGKISDIRIEKWNELSLDSQLLQSLASLHSPKDIAFQFAVPVAVNYLPENSGRFYNVGDELIWITGIRSKNARSLNLILKPFHIPEGAYVYIYDSKKSVVRGAFTSINNNPSDILPTMPVPGEELILEYHLPAGVKWKGTLGISQVSHDYLGVFGPEPAKDSRFRLSQPCNVDINCPPGDNYQTEKRSVCRLIIRGIELCSGFLINNADEKNLPYLITAQHCITDENDASMTIFVFGYESPWCEGPDGRVSHSLAGSVLRSTNPDIDFTLVELSSFPPFIYKPYLAGWDVSGISPQGAVTIHHPQGDVKKISVDLAPPVTSTFTGFITDGFWQVLQWAYGTTEGGSSGAPLFDQNKRVIGALTGGEAICGRSENDYFGKLAVTYDLSPVLGQQLKGWIDPSGTGVMQLDGRDPYAPNWLTVDTLSNIKPSESLTNTIYTPPGTGYATGFNSDSLVMYAEYFTNPQGRQIGEILVDISKANWVLSSDSVRFYVLNDGPVPGQVLASQRIWQYEVKDSFLLKVDFNTTIPVTGNFYIGWRIWYKNRAILETRQFAVFHSPDRVLPERNTAWFNDGSGWKTFLEHPLKSMSVSLSVSVVAVGNPALNEKKIPGLPARQFTVYPNPAKDVVIISTVSPLQDIDLTVTDLSGTTLSYEHFSNRFPGEVSLNVADLKPGIYFLNFKSTKIKESYKVLITR